MSKDKKKEEEYDIDIRAKAIALIKEEKETWQDAVVFITKDVAFKMRNLIETLRKNYWGVFETPNDPITGKPKTWIPLSEVVADNYVTNTDIDEDNLDVTAKKGSAYGLASIVRAAVGKWMDENIFGEALDETERSMGIDGSAVWKTYEGYDKQGKKTMIREDVDLLNLYFDPTAKSLQDAYRVTEKALMTPKEISSMDGWYDTDDLKGTVQIQSSTAHSSQVTTNYRDVWEIWGLIPKYLITGKKKDEEEIEGHIAISGMEGEKDGIKVHLIEENVKDWKPYEEGHTKKVRGRWLARGPVEAVIGLQSWINTIVNIRLNRNQVAQLGLFKIKKNSGISPGMIRNLAANGAVLVRNMDDIEQWQMQEASMGSYTDENSALGWAQKVTSAFPVATGEPSEKGTTATDIVVKSRATNSTFKIYRDQIGYFLIRWLKRHGFPIIAKTSLKKMEIVRLTGSYEEMVEVDSRLVDYLIYKKLEKMNKDRVSITPEQVMAARKEAMVKLQRMGKNRYFTILDKIDLSEYDIRFTFTNQEIDKQNIVNNLVGALKLAPDYQDVIIGKVFDMMGLDTFELENSIKKAREAQPQGQPQGQSKQEVRPNIQKNVSQVRQGNR